MTNHNQSLHDTNRIHSIDTNACHHYNMNILQRYPYRIDTKGIYDENFPTLEPIEWVKSDEGREHIYKIYSKTDDIVSLFKFNTINTYTTSFYVWLGYLKHCIGNIETAIATELVTLL